MGSTWGATCEFNLTPGKWAYFWLAFSPNVWEPSVVPALSVKVFCHPAPCAQRVPSKLSLPSSPNALRVVLAIQGYSSGRFQLPVFLSIFHIFQCFQKMSVCYAAIALPSPSPITQATLSPDTQCPFLFKLLTFSDVVTPSQHKSQPAKLLEEKGDHFCYMTGEMTVLGSLSKPNLDM